MLNNRLNRVNKYSSEVLDTLTLGLGPESQSREVSNNPPNSGIMAVHVEWLWRVGGMDIFAVSHTYEQNGDLMRDPEMQFIREQDGRTTFYYPFSFRQDGLGVDRESVKFDNDWKITAINTREQADEAHFANVWMKNIRSQQRLEAKITGN